jgi:hypothetical protein
MRYGRWATVTTVAVGLIGAFAGSPVRAADVVVEKIPLRYVDARYVALILGGSVLPTEADLVMGRVGFGGYGGFGGGIPGGYGGGGMPGNGVFGDPSTNSILILPGGAFQGGSVYGDPSSNSLLVGPRSGSARRRAPAGNRIYGVPGSNSLLYRR